MEALPLEALPSEGLPLEALPSEGHPSVELPSAVYPPAVAVAPAEIAPLAASVAPDFGVLELALWLGAASSVRCRTLRTLVCFVLWDLG